MNTFAFKEDAKLACVLGILAALATATLFPYLLLVTPQLMDKVPKGVTLPMLVSLQSLQAGVVLFVLSLIGLRFAHPVGLDAPWLRAILFRRPLVQQQWASAIGLGLAAGFVIVGLDPLFAPHLPAPFHAQQAPTAGTSAGAGFLASFYGGIAEELMMRLFAMTLLVRLFSIFSGGRAGSPQFWGAIVLAAILFGVGHLPAAAQTWPLDAIVVTRVLLLNGVGGLVFGWLYWKRGLESAMLAHFSADLLLHVAAPLALG
jgi:membrane protease YdiL (CAAX protease family)